MLAFGLRLQSLEGQREVIEDMRARLEPAATGVRATVAGLPVLAADANHAMSDPLRRLAARRWPGCSSVALALFAVYRSWTRAWVPLGPDRARDGLVVARAVARRRAAEPDVGGAQRARDRDRDGVRGAAERALPRRARGRLRGAGGAGAHLPLDRRRRVRLRRDRAGGLRRV